MAADDLVAWLRAQLDEDERIMQAAYGHHWLDDDEWVIDEDAHILEGQPANARHAARHDPAYVTADITAKRQILDRCAEVLESASDHHTVESCDEEDAVLAEAVIRRLASAYAGRNGCPNGYRDEWRP